MKEFRKQLAEETLSKLFGSTDRKILLNILTIAFLKVQLETIENLDLQIKEEPKEAVG